jgi:hypothetical protein
MTTLTVSITYPSFEPPPSYDIAITSRPTVPVYTAEAAPSFEMVEQINNLARQPAVEELPVNVGDTSLTGCGALGMADTAV